MRNNSVGNRADEAQNNQLQIGFEMRPAKYLPQLTLYLSLSETRLDFPFFFTMMVQFVALAALQRRTIIKTSAKNAGDRMIGGVERRACGALGRSRNGVPVMSS